MLVGFIGFQHIDNSRPHRGNRTGHIGTKKRARAGYQRD